MYYNSVVFVLTTTQDGPFHFDIFEERVKNKNVITALIRVELLCTSMIVLNGSKNISLLQYKTLPVCL